MRRKGWRQHALHWPASADLGPKFMAYCLLTRPSVATARRWAELSRSDGLHAPSTEQRGYQAGATLHRWECSRVFFVAEPASRPGLRLWGAPPQRWACFRVDQLSDKPRAAPEPQGPSRRTCHGRIQTLAEDQSRRKTGGGFCCWRPVGDLRRSVERAGITREPAVRASR
jgi:hypothetical protein